MFASANISRKHNHFLLPIQLPEEKNGKIFLKNNVISPLFQLCSFITRPSPLGLNGPFSENAPTPSEEHPGPAYTNCKYSKKIETLSRKRTPQKQKCLEIVYLHSTTKLKALKLDPFQLQQNSKKEIFASYHQQ